MIHLSDIYFLNGQLYDQMIEINNFNNINHIMVARVHTALQQMTISQEALTMLPMKLAI